MFPPRTCNLFYFEFCVLRVYVHWLPEQPPWAVQITRNPSLGSASFSCHPSHSTKEMEEDVKMEDSESSGSCLAKSPTRRILFQSPEKEPGPFRPFVATAKSTASPASSAASPPGQRGQYNCPIGLYSAHNLREMALMQCKLGEAEPAAGGQLCLPG